MGIGVDVAQSAAMEACRATKGGALTVEASIPLPPVLNVRVREATADDVPRIVEMALAFIRSSEYRGVLAANPAQIERCAHLMIAGDQFVLFVAEKAGSVVGMAGFIVHEHLFSAERVADELFWWVDETARGRAGILLLRRAEQWARERSAVAIQMIAPNEDVERFYSKVGYVPIERSYQKRF